MLEIFYFRNHSIALIGCSCFAGKDIANKNQNTHLMKSFIQTSCSKPAVILPYGSIWGNYAPNFYLHQYKPSETNLEPIFVKMLWRLISSEFIPISMEGNVVVVFYVDFAFELSFERIKLFILSISHIAELVFTELKATCDRCIVRLEGPSWRI